MSSVKDFEEPEITSEIETLRHSTAHVMAHAIQKLWPQAKFGIGPTVEDGFYYDVDIDFPLLPEHLKSIEKEMKKIIGQNNEFIRKEHSISEALKIFKELDQPYKIEIIETLRDQMGATSVSSYTEGSFTDLCRGPHIQKTVQIKAFKLLSVAGAYWRGNEKNKQLQRIYGTAFLSKEELDEHLRLLEEAKKRDHRKLGKELDLFSFHDVAPAMAFLHPKGAFIYRKLQEFIRGHLNRTGYQEVLAPQIVDSSLWKQSGHYENYKENMFFCEIDNREFAVKPMNCPGHILIYQTQRHSYRDLPLRLSEFGHVHRYERSGVTMGLMRVRSFTQDDAHLFCMPSQIEAEIESLVHTILSIFKTFEFSDVKIYLSTRPEKKVGGEELWDQAEAALKNVLDQARLPYETNEGDGAFYGPKIDFNVRDAIKRYHQLATIQLDFNLPERFDLKYVGEDNQFHRPVMIHRAILGSLERFMGILIEHTGGAFPFWLAPVQARLIPIKSDHIEYCQKIKKELEIKGLRIEIDERNESMGLKTREVQKAKIPYGLFAGDREVESNSFSVRKYGEQKSETWTQDEVFKKFEALNKIPG